ncbi:MAG: hypothetical protein ACXVJT_09240, partial [Thermoanaerobaculia bacterium]
LRLIFACATALAISAATFAQEPPSPTPPQTPPETQQTPPPEPQPQPQPAVEPQPPITPPAPPETPVDQTNPPVPAPPSILSQAAGMSYDRRDSLPNVNVYLPEGQASVRIRKLIRNVLFESQIEYKFVEGDVSTFLRYKYYARNFTYKLGVFDSIGFPSVGSTSKKEFERVRGGLLLFELPRDYNERYFWLLQDDRLTFGDVTNPDDRKNNIYTKIGYQYGTQFDERMNAIVGESRGRITPVLTAFRELGPQKVGFAAGVTESAKIGTGDYKYTKIESELLKRFDISSTTFFVARAHVGVFVTRSKQPGSELLDPIERYTIPRYEMFGLGGRESLRSIKDTVDSEGTHEFHVTNEYFFPIFRNRDYRTYLLHWNTMYGIGYLGAGSVGFNYGDVGKSDNSVVDAGLGTEISVNLRDFDVLLSMLYAHTVRAPSCSNPPTVGCRDLGNGRLLFSIRTVR